MRAAWRAVVAAMPMLLFVWACSGERTVTMDDEGSRVELSPGGELELVLPGNPSTGYEWRITEMTPGILAVDDEPEFLPESDLVGAPGEFHFRFVAGGTGTGRLVLVYERPFEETDPVDTFEIEVVVG